MTPEREPPTMVIFVACGGYTVDILCDNSSTDCQGPSLKWESHVFTTEEQVADFVRRSLRENLAISAGTDEAGELAVSEVVKED